MLYIVCACVTVARDKRLPSVCNHDFVILDSSIDRSQIYETATNNQLQKHCKSVLWPRSREKLTMHDISEYEEKATSTMPESCDWRRSCRASISCRYRRILRLSRYRERSIKMTKRYVSFLSSTRKIDAHTIDRCYTTVATRSESRRVQIVVIYTFDLCKRSTSRCDATRRWRNCPYFCIQRDIFFIALFARLALQKLGIGSIVSTASNINPVIIT